MYRDQDGLNRDLILANRRQRRRWRGSQADFARSSLRLIRIPSNNRCPPNSAPDSVANRIALSGSSLLRPFATHAAAVASTMGKVRSLFSAAHQFSRYPPRVAPIVAPQWPRVQAPRRGRLRTNAAVISRKNMGFMIGCGCMRTIMWCRR